MEGFLLVLLGIGFLLVLSSLKVIDQYERGIVLTLGSYSYTLQPGLRIIIPIIITVMFAIVGILFIVYSSSSLYSIMIIHNIIALIIPPAP